MNNSIADVAMGFTDLLRVGNGVGYALTNCDDNIYGKTAYITMDVARASAIFTILAGPASKVSSVIRNLITPTTTSAELSVLARMSGILRDAAKGKGNFGLGQATHSEAMELGRAWVGKGYSIASDGKTLVSADKLRVFRPPTYKPKLGKTQANFEWRNFKGGEPTGNGHLDIITP